MSNPLRGALSLNAEDSGQFKNTSGYFRGLELADWLPPLKAALRGVNALIKQYKDIKKKATQLIPWLKKLKDSPVTIADDPEEEQRRIEFSSSLERIKKRPQASLEKKKTSSWVFGKWSISLRNRSFVGVFVPSPRHFQRDGLLKSAGGTRAMAGHAIIIQ